MGDLLGDELAIGAASDHLAWSGGKVVVFEIGEQVCGLPLERVREIAPMCELSRPPGIPSLLEGLLNLHGEITPVVSSERLFGLPAVAFHRYTQLLILRGTTPLALISRRVLRVAVYASTDLLTAPQDTVFNHCLEGVLPAPQGAIHLLHADQLLLAQEKQRISELQLLVQSRLASLEEVNS